MSGMFETKSFTKNCAKKRKIDSENREFQEKWEEEYFFGKNKDKPQCLVCAQTISSCKEYNVKRHYTTLHGAKYAKYTGEARLTIIKDLKSKLCKQKNIFSAVTTTQKAAVKASFLVAEEIAKRKYPFSSGTLVKTCALKMAEAFGNETMAKTVESISLSHQTVARHICTINQHLTDKLQNILRSAPYFSIALDESTDITDTCQLVIFVRSVDQEFHISEELLEIVPLHGSTKGEDIYNAVKATVTKYGGFSSCTCIVTDGARAMVGRNQGLAGRLRKEGIDCHMFHCIVHQEVLCGTSLKMADIMDVVTKVTNLIRGGNRSLTHRRFKNFLEELDAAYGDLLLHTNVRWLSAGKCLVRFFALRKEIHLYLSDIKCDSYLLEHLTDVSFLTALAFLTDITQFLNSLNLNLQGRDQNVSQLYSHIAAFRNKLHLLKSFLAKNDLTHFESCCELFQEMKGNGVILNFSQFVPKMDILIHEFNTRFQDFEGMEASFKLFNNPINTDIAAQDTKYHMELCELQGDQFLHSCSEKGVAFFKLLSQEQYPILRDFGMRMASMFGSTYICEKAFSDMGFIKSKYRNSICDSTLQQIIRISTTSISADIDELVAQQLHPQTSH
ncbi:general transcription factor II-I repeat domain-containing protein 2B-like [Xenopus tropicalis]|uniref:General transcription factor II-I repeat domain-containing protein 2B-like n=1 Tax=Xenopus tropicalis TaxID=8364 RepID=A0A8J1IM42_XENTR|nr:general transcription factor II-I repeat domain-containing protein 2B-like [Xenopus tropicalis]